MKFLFLLFFIFLLNCDNTPISSGAKADELKLLFYNVRSITTSSATVVWACSQEASGYLVYGKGTGAENTAFSIVKAKTHAINITGLTTGNTIQFTAFCKTEMRTVSTAFTTFKTQDTIVIGTPLPDDPPKSPLSEPARDEPKGVPKDVSVVINRGIFLVGGVGNGNAAVSQIDFYDPDTDTWTAGYTTLPTPRVYAGVVSLGGKIYVIGGINSTLNTVSNAVEEFNPLTKVWRTMNAMPLPIAGAVVASVGNAIYVVAGSISGGPTTAISTPPLNTIYQFIPDTNTWTTLVSPSSILPRADMGGCAINGIIYLVTGRTYPGIVQNTSGTYIPSTNTVASGTVSSFNQTKHGVGSACYRPISSDPFPNDVPVLVSIGGSTANNTFYPPDSMVLSSMYEVYVGGVTNTVSLGTVLPVSVYYPAVEFSYSKRSVFVFGGASAINVPTQNVYFFSMASTAGVWTQVTSMPVPRFGHKAVIVSR